MILTAAGRRFKPMHTIWRRAQKMRPAYMGCEIFELENRIGFGSDWI